MLVGGLSLYQGGHDFFEDDGSSKTTRFLSERRRLLPHEGVMRTLVLRVTDGRGETPVTDARRESDTWFGTHNMTLARNQNSMVCLCVVFIEHIILVLVCIEITIY